MKISVLTLGCKVNECESRSLIAALRSSGAEVTEDAVSADAYIINTCSVTGEADRKSRQLVGKASRLNPNAAVYVLGCSSQNDATPFLKMKNVVYVSGNGRKSEILRYIMSGIVPGERNFVEKPPLTFEEMVCPAHEKTRDYIRIQDGCNNFCSYCVIPFVRGRSRSRALSSVVEEARKAAEHTKEIVLTGIDVSSYGKDIGTDLTELVRALGDIPVRKRLSSFECNVINDELLYALKESGFNDHFHMSLQSGSDDVLRAMNRHYTTDKFLGVVESVRKVFPDAGITTDIIAGFPTETEPDFEGACSFVRKVGFSDMHVFPYSERKGTRAAAMKQIPMELRRERAARLTEIKTELKKAFLEKQIGKTLDVYFEDNEDGMTGGYATNYVRVYSDSAKPGDILPITVSQIYKQGVK